MSLWQEGCQAKDQHYWWGFRQGSPHGALFVHSPTSHQGRHAVEGWRGGSLSTTCGLSPGCSFSFTLKREWLS